MTEPDSAGPALPTAAGSGAVARGTLLQVVGRLVGTVLSLATAALVARRLGVTGFGSYSLAILVGSVAATIADLGLAAVAVRELAATGIDAVWGYLRLKTGVQLTIYLVTAMIVGFSPLLSPGVRLPASLAVVAVALTSVSASFQLPYQVDVRWLIPVVSDVTGRAALLAVVLVLVSHHAGLVPLVGAIVIGNSIGLVVLAGDYIRRGYPRRGRLPRLTARPYLARSFVLGAVLILGFVHFKADSVIIAGVRSRHDLGVYSAAYRFIEYTLLLPGLFLQVVYPVLVRARASGRVAYGIAVQRSWDAVAVSGVLLCAALGLGAPVLVRLLGGDRFSAATTPLRILAVAACFAWLNTLFAQLAVVASLQRRVLWLSVAAVTANIVANLIVIPHFGYNGAAVTTVASEGLGAVAVAVVVLTSEQLSLRQHRSSRAGIAAALAVGVYAVTTTAMPDGLAVGLALGVLGLCAALLGAIRVTDLRQLVLALTRRTSVLSPSVDGFDE